MAKLPLKVRRLVTMSAAIAAGAITAGFSQQASATTLTWDPANDGSLSGAVGGTWDLNTTANWWNGALPDVTWTDSSALGTDTAVFNNAGGAITVENTLSRFSALGLQFLSTGYTLSGRTGSEVLTVGSGGITANASTTTVVNTTLTLAPVGAQTWTLGNSANLTINSALSLQNGQTWSLGTGASLIANAPLTLLGNQTWTLGANASLAINDILSINGAQSWSAGSGATLSAVGAVTRNPGSTDNFSSTGTFNGAGLLAAVDPAGDHTVQGWATIGGTDWAVGNGTAIVALSSYTTASATVATDAAANIDMNFPSATNITAAGAVNPNSLRFSGAAANTLTLTGTNTITTGGILVSSAVGNHLSTITGGTLLGASGGELIVIQNNTFNSLTISSAIGDNNGSGLTKSGQGLLILSGSNSYTGNTFVNAGTVRFVDTAPNSSPLLLPAPSPPTLTIAGGATLEFNVSTTPHVADDTPQANVSLGYTQGGTTITGSGTFLKTGSGTLALDGSDGSASVTFAMTGGTIDIEGGTLRNGNSQGASGGNWNTSTPNLSSLNIGPSGTFDMGNGFPVYVDALTGSGTFTNHWPDVANAGQPAGSDGVFSLYLGNNNGSGTFAGTLRDNDGLGNNSAALAVYKEGTGTQTLSDTGSKITYSGGTEIDGGSLVLQNTITGNGNFYIANGTLNFYVTTGTLTLKGNTNSYSMIGPNSAPGTGIADNGVGGQGTGNLVKSGSGTLVLGATGLPETISLTGLIDVQGGILKTVSSGNAVWAGNTAALQVDAGATFDTGDADVPVDYLAGAPTATITKTASGNNTLTIGINNNASGSLNGGTATFSGNITSPGGTLNLIKSGTGMQILSGSNTYTGTTTITGGGILSTGTTGILANGGIASSIGKSSNVASNLVIDGGTLQYANTGAAESTNRLFTVTPNGATLNASGANSITFAGHAPAAGNVVAYQTAGTTEMLTFTGTGIGVLNSAINDNGAATSVTMNGTGTWSLNAANTYTGVTMIASVMLGDGTVVLPGILSTGTAGKLRNGLLSSSIGASTNVATNLVIDGGTLQYANTGAAEATDRLFTVTSNGATLDASGTNSITFNGNSASGTNAIAFNIVISPETDLLPITLTGTGVGVFKPIINDNAGGPTSLVKMGAGTWTVSGTNTFTGGTTIAAGTLILGNVAALGDPTSNIVAVTGGTLDLHGLSPTVNGLSDSVYDVAVSPITNGSSSSAGTIRSTTGTPTLNITTNINSDINLGLGLTYSGTISGPITVAVGGSGFQYFTGNNSYSGGTFVNNTATLVGSTSSFGAGNLTVAAGAAASSTGSIASTAVVTINTDGVNPGFVYFNDANPTIASLMGGGSVTLNANVLPSQGVTTLTINNGGNFSGTITDSPDGNGSGLGAIKLTGGTLILSGSNGYSGGTAITGGTLMAMSPNSTGGGSVTVSGGRLGGTGVIVNSGGPLVTITTGGTISPGPDAANTTVGTLTTGDMTWDHGTYVFKTISTTASSTLAATLAGGTTQDFLVVNGILDLDVHDHGKFTINISDSGQLATPFVIANASTIAENETAIDIGQLPYDVTNDFIVQDNGGTNGRYLVTIVADGNDPTGALGYDVQISESAVAPEPSSLGLLGLASLGLLRRRRATGKI